MKKDKHSINKAFVSEYDIFLEKFKKTHALSASQIKERDKHAKIASLRDVAKKDVQANIWEEF